MKKNKTKTGIEYLRGIYDKENKCPLVFEASEMLQLETMNEFSLWLSDKGWNMPYYNGDWYNENISENAYRFSKVYKLFLESRNK
jgi:hypothetical protein